VKVVNRAYIYERTKACNYCGRIFTYSAHQNQRRYCSRSCGSKASYNGNPPGSTERVWGHDKRVFEEAMEMYWGGYGGAEIARHFKIPNGTVYSWVHDFGSQRERTELPVSPSVKIPAAKPLKERFRTAGSSDEWLETLRENTLVEDESFEDMSITLVCGTLHGQSANKLASVIYESLKEDPQSGRGYAFCNKGRNSIAVLSWKAPVYRISKYVRAHGTFIWPHEELGKTIEITKAEFDRLLLLEKYRNSAETISPITAINLDFMRV